MSSSRTHDDTWDIATSVGAPRCMVAAARAAETDQPDPLIRDPYAKMLVEGVGTGMWEHMLDESMVDRLKDIEPAEMALIFDAHAQLPGRAHPFLRRLLRRAAEAGIRQIVILASGLDSRAYRLEWPPGTVVFEIDQPKVLEYKAATLAAHGVQPSRTRHEVAIDLRFDWPAALKAAGFDPAEPTAWLAEGLLMYLPSDAQDRLFEQITALSAPGSRIAAETAATHAEDRREDMRRRFERVADQLGMTQSLDIGDLVYNDPDRTELTGWLDRAGWRASGLPRTGGDAAARSLGRRPDVRR